MKPLLLVEPGHASRSFHDISLFPQIGSSHETTTVRLSAMSSSNGSLKRREMDVTKLMMFDYNLTLVNDSINKFHVDFTGPAQSLYASGFWKIKVDLPPEYPYKSPSIGFANHVFHPNVCPSGGAVCLDVINQTWSPMYDLVNVFETFLPQLLLYPNPADPLNGEAAALLLKDPLAYEAKVKEMVEKYASVEALSKLNDKKDATLGEGTAVTSAVTTTPVYDDMGADDYVSSDEDEDDRENEDPMCAVK